MKVVNFPLPNASAMVLALCFLACGPQQTQQAPEALETPEAPFIEQENIALLSLLPTDAEVEVLAEGFEWSEGPVWVPEGDYVLFSDIPPNRVYKWKEGEGKSLYLEPSGYSGDEAREGEPGSNGLLLDAQGRLVLCQHGNRMVAYMDAPLDAPESSFTPLAETWDGKRFNSPNDATFHSDGSLYFTDPPYGLEGGVEDPAKEIPFQGVYRRSPEGAITLLTDELSRPNGIAFSPDEQTLYVANSDPKKAIWMAYDVLEDGSLSGGRVFFDATAWVGDRKGLPDGMAVDAQGNVWATGPGGVLIFTPQGEHLGTIRTGQATANCTFGRNGSELYITADMYLMRVKLPG